MLSGLMGIFASQSCSQHPEVVRPIRELEPIVEDQKFAGWKCRECEKGCDVRD